MIVKSQKGLEFQLKLVVSSELVKVFIRWESTQGFSYGDSRYLTIRELEQSRFDLLDTKINEWVQQLEDVVYSRVDASAM